MISLLANSTMPGQHSDIAPAVDALYWFIFWCSLAIFGIVVFTIIYFVLKYRSESVRDKLEEQVSHNSKIEFFWTLIPTILIIIVFFWGAGDWKEITSKRANADTIQVTASNWQFVFSYTSDAKTFSVSDSLVIPKGKNIELAMTADKSSFIHSLYIPDFRLKQDVMPNRYSSLWFRSDNIGTYDYYCAEYCGIGHSGMNGHVIVMPAKKEPFTDKVIANKEYDQWDTFEDENNNGDWDDSERFTDSENGKYDEGEDFEDLNGNGKWDTGYDYWLERRLAKNEKLQQLEGAERGEALYNQDIETTNGMILGCAACHSNGENRSNKAPSFKGLFESPQPGGKGIVDEDYLIESIMYPDKKVREGFEKGQMPKDYNKLSTKDITGLIEYIKTLK